MRQEGLKNLKLIGSIEGKKSRGDGKEGRSRPRMKYLTNKNKSGYERGRTAGKEAGDRHDPPRLDRTGQIET